jgi:DNA-binding IclR family transcriptional regulator
LLGGRCGGIVFEHYVPDGWPELSLKRADLGDTPGGPIRSLAKGLELLDFVVTAGEPVRLRDVAAHFGYDRSSALRILATLEESGFLSKHPGSKHYLPGPKLARLRRLAPARGLLTERLRPDLNRVNALTGMTTYLGVLEHDQALLIEVIAAQHVISVRQLASDTEPLYRGAVGKSLLANLPAQLQQALVDSMRFQKFTANTITNKKALLAELAEIRASGVAFDEGEGHEDVCCIAAPVLDDTGYPLASIGISMVRAMVPNGARGQIEWINIIREAAASARRLLVPT